MCKCMFINTKCNTLLCYLTLQLLALRQNDYSVSATIAWKRAELEAGSGETSMTVADTILIASLEGALKKKNDMVGLAPSGIYQEWLHFYYHT